MANRNLVRDHWRHQPRVPRGVGEEGGQWTDDPTWAVKAATQLGIKANQPPTLSDHAMRLAEDLARHQPDRVSRQQLNIPAKVEQELVDAGVLRLENSQAAVEIPPWLSTRMADSPPLLRGSLGWEKLKDQQAGKISATVGQAEGVDLYGSNAAYVRVQNMTRGSDIAPIRTKAQRDAAKSIAAIDELVATDGAVLDEPVEAWRGVAGVADVFPGGLGAGDEFIDNGIVSLSFEQGHSLSFARDFGYENGVLFKVKVPAGKRGLVLEAVQTDVRVAAGAAQEREMVLPRGSRFRVVRKLEDTRPAGIDVGVPTYEVEVVDTPVGEPLPEHVQDYLRRSRRSGRSKQQLGEGPRDFKGNKWPHTGQGQDPPEALALMTGVLDNRGVAKPEGRTRHMGNYHMLTDEERTYVARQMNVTRKVLDAFIKQQDSFAR